MGCEPDTNRQKPFKLEITFWFIAFWNIETCDYASLCVIYSLYNHLISKILQKSPLKKLCKYAKSPLKKLCKYVKSPLKKFIFAAESRLKKFKNVK